MRLPSGLKATQFTSQAWPLQVRISAPVDTSQILTVPSLAARGQALAVLVKGDAADPADVPFYRSHIFAGCGVPEAHGCVPAGGGQQPAVRAEGHAPDPILVPL